MELTDNQTKVRDALPDEGAAAPATIAERSGLGYSTVTRLLRDLADTGHAVKEPDGWRRTTTANGGADTEADTGADAIKTEPDNATTDLAPPHDVAAGAPTEPTANASPDEPEPVADHKPDDPTEGLDGSAVETTDDPDPAIQPVAVTPTVDEPIGDRADDAEDQGPGIDAAGRPRLHKGQLRDQVLAVLRAADEPLGPTQMSKLLDGRSQGAIANACDKLVNAGDAIRTSEKPQRFAATPTA